MAIISQITKPEGAHDNRIDAYMIRKAEKLRIISGPRWGEATPEQVITMFSDYGRVISDRLMARVMEMTPEARGGFLQEAGGVLNAAFGTEFKTSPMYRAFPRHEDVMIPYDLVQFLLAAHFWKDHQVSAATHGADPVTGQQTQELGPDEDLDAQAAGQTPIIWEGREFKVVDLAETRDVRAMATTVLSGMTAFTPDDAEFIAACVDEGVITAEDIGMVRFREKIPALAGLVSEDVYVNSAVSLTDALRLAAHFSGEDVSLSGRVRFKLAKAAGKRVFRMAEAIVEQNVGSAGEDILRQEEAWKRLARHVGTERARKAAPLFMALLDDVRAGKVRSFASEVKHAIPELAADMLMKRPGTFVRETLSLSRRFDAEGADRDWLLSCARRAFAAAPALSLFQLRTVLSRTVREEDRFHVMKTGKTVRSERPVENHDDLLNVLETVMRERFSGTLPWSAAKNGENRFVPIGARSASESGDGSVRGDSVLLSDAEAEAKVARLFLHWKDLGDVDLSAVFMNESHQIIGECSFMNLKSSDKRNGNKIFAIHSGDIRDGRRGAAEYVDIEMKAAKEAGVAFVMVVANVYSGKPFNSFPSHVGVMTRDGVNGRHFEPGSVECSMKITANATYCVPALLDLRDMRLIHADIPAQYAQLRSATSNEGGISETMGLLTRYGRYRASMADVLEFAGTPDGPVMTDKELLAQRAEILSLVSQVPALDISEPEGPSL